MKFDSGQELRMDLDRVVKVAFVKDPASPLGHRADLVSSASAGPAAQSESVDSIPALQLLRETIGSGAGDTRWVRVRQEGATGDGEDAYVNLDAVRRVEFDQARDGPIARIEGENGSRLGEVHLPGALDAVRNLKIAPR
jgi:hypothetical protein